MPAFGQRSLSHLDTCHDELQTLCHSLIRFYDFSVIEGTRSDERQAQLFAEGRSTLDGVTQRSKHQTYPSRAVDLLPYPAELHGVNVWQDRQRFAHFIGQLKGHAQLLKIEIRVGMDWDGDGSPHNHRFVDYPHVELA